MGENGILDIERQVFFFLCFTLFFLIKIHSENKTLKKYISLRENLYIIFKEGERDDFSIKYTPLSSSPGVLTISWFLHNARDQSYVLTLLDVC